MAAIGISEFTFGYAFLYEQTHNNWSNLRAAPILPSLQQEYDQGWDARLPLVGVDYYYQFKLSDHLSRRNASYIADGTYDRAYYRLALHPKDNNRQHQRLRIHAQANPHTYYVAPEFSSIDDFNVAFLGHNITSRSRLIPVANCDDISDGDQHYITFQSGIPSWNQHSEKKNHDTSILGRDLAKHYRETKNQWQTIDKQFADRLWRKTSEVAKTIMQEDMGSKTNGLALLDFEPERFNRREVLIRTSQVLATFLGSTLVLVGAPQK